MTATSRPDFGADTEGLEVAKEFASAIRGKTVLITGVNRSGIGFSTSQAIASQSPARLIIAGRSQSKISECIDALKAEFPDVDYRALEIDLSSQQSVRAAATEVLNWSDVPVINIVINSAGVMGIQERTLTKEGIEMHFATNHIGHWLLTCLIMPKLIKAAESSPKGTTRVVNVSSGSPTMSTMRWSDPNFDKKNKDLPEAEQPHYEWFKAWGYKDSENVAYVPLDGYNRSKVANVLFGIGANKRLFDKYGIVTLAVHPGVINTELGRNFPPETMGAIKAMADAGHFSWKTLGAGSSTSLVAALDPKLGVGCGETMDGSENWGAFLMDCQISGQANPLAVSSKEAEKLWQQSEKLVNQSFEW
ncbi:MAG: hypothetical protein Q9227_002996 [Pyrenula ochraceoflavens]